jgi:cytoplasmic iron level regulating protein YaaA (DUF328/UPF0246 family)
MLIVLSPAKKLDFSKKFALEEYSIPVFRNEAQELVNILKKIKPEDLSSLMGISAKLADLNYERFLKWTKDHNINNSKQAILAFNGDVYEGLDASTLNTDSLNFINKNVRILSGLYGILRPFDPIMEYRLEMGTKLSNSRGNDLYQFWGDKITQQINKAIEESDSEKVLINLASTEYFKAIKPGLLQYPVITPIFKEYKDDDYQFVSFFAKKARGLMARFAAEQKCTNAEQLKMFNLEKYAFSQELSFQNQWVFTR